ncbi:fatty acid binding protein 7, brain, b [Clarias gariepinus]|uniref:fatty acid-binding protein, brain-like n=1 Tax=Clarias gariepinus TaxID=13013 RepID=UPI00234C390D|nr:fatty acid-binding protein, brain-like [Clarias gariepinus]
MDKFIGTWKLVSSENFDHFMDRVGVEHEKKTFAHDAQPILKISQKGDKVVFLIESIVGAHKYSFKLSEEFQNKSQDGRSWKSVVNLEGDKLIEMLTWDKVELTVVHEIKDKKLFKTFKVHDAVAVRIFERV